MKSILVSALLILGPVHAAAQSLCDQRDPAKVMEALVGLWRGDVAVSVETETVSATEVMDAGRHWMREDGGFVTYLIAGWTEAPVDLALSEAPIYDVDGVDDLLETTSREVFADLLSDTPCGPETLPQMTGQFVSDLAEGEGSVTGAVTLIGYFEDRVLMLVEAELTGDWGLGFVTATALLTPES